MTINTDKDSREEIYIRMWVRRGEGIMVHAEALDIDDPDHVYNQIIYQGKIPEEYGYHHPYGEEFKDKTREQLIQEIVNLKKEINNLYRIAGGIL